MKIDRLKNRRNHTGKKKKASNYCICKWFIFGYLLVKRAIIIGWHSAHHIYLAVTRSNHSFQACWWWSGAQQSNTALPEFKSLIFDTQNCLNLISLIFDTQNLLDNIKELQYEKFEHLPDMETWSEENLPFPCIGLSQRAHKQMLWWSCLLLNKCGIN